MTIEAAPTIRVRLDLSYDGTDFSGWALQPGRRTVQGVVERGLATVLRLPSVALTVAGRTDAGVHATGQIAHTDLPAAVWEAAADRLLRRLAAVLPDDVRVRTVSAVSAHFDARFAALWRRYDYRISDAEWGVDPIRRRFVHWSRHPLDAAAMAAAATGFLGLRDFAGFCRFRAGGTTVRTLQCFDVLRAGTDIVCAVQADAFCHSMVRSLVGALIAVGEGRRDAEWAVALLQRSTRADEVMVAPAHGLTLTAVGYPPESELAARAEQTRARRVQLPGRGPLNPLDPLNPPAGG